MKQIDTMKADRRVPVITSAFAKRFRNMRATDTRFKLPKKKIRASKLNVYHNSQNRLSKAGSSRIMTSHDQLDEKVVMGALAKNMNVMSEGDATWREDKTEQVASEEPRTGTVTTDEGRSSQAKYEKEEEGSDCCSHCGETEEDAGQDVEGMVESKMTADVQKTEQVQRLHADNQQLKSSNAALRKEAESHNMRMYMREEYLHQCYAAQVYFNEAVIKDLRSELESLGRIRDERAWLERKRAIEEAVNEELNAMPHRQKFQESWNKYQKQRAAHHS